MGAYLSEPVTIKHVEIPCENNDGNMAYACCSLQGWRRHQEDAHIRPQKLNNSVQILGVYDGHGGADVARFVENNLIKVLIEDAHFKKKDYGKALQNTYLKIDEMILTKAGQKELKLMDQKANLDEEADSELMKELGKSYEQKEGDDSAIIIKGEKTIVYTEIDNDGNKCNNSSNSNSGGSSIISSYGSSNSTHKKKTGDNSNTNGVLTKEALEKKLEEKIRILLESSKNLPAAEAKKKNNTKSSNKGATAKNNSTNEDDDNEAVDIESVDFGLHSGCTATTCLIIDNKTIICGNSGDSRCVLSRNKVAFPLSNDHNPDVQSEVDRIEKAGGTVSEDGRVEGNLNLSRALGDLMYKQNNDLGPEEQMITGFPEVMYTDIQPKDDYLVIGCDGIFNVLTNQEVIDFVHAGLALNQTLGEIAANMCDRCMTTDANGDGTGCDNETVIILKLNNDGGSSSSSTSLKKRPSDHGDEKKPKRNRNN